MKQQKKLIHLLIFCIKMELLTNVNLSLFMNLRKFSTKQQFNLQESGTKVAISSL